MSSNSIEPTYSTSSRRPPPPPSRTPPQSPLISSKHIERPSASNHNPLVFTKKPSEANIKPDVQRRRSMQNGSRPPPELTESLAQTNLESQRQYVRNSTMGDSAITHDLLQILKDENRNLKEQNNFLLSKIRQTNESERLLKEAVLHYELIISQLGDRNQELHRENRELTQIASRRVEQFGYKLAELMGDKAESEPQQTGDFRINDPSFQQFQTTSTPGQYYQMLANRPANQQFNSIPGIRSNGIPPMPPRPPVKTQLSTEPNDSELEELNNQFEALIYSCRVEKNAEKRKHIRKRLVEITYRMRELKRQ